MSFVSFLGVGTAHKMASIVKVLVVFSSLLAISHATRAYEYPYYVNTGTSKQYRSQDDNGNYQFGYDEGHSSGGTFRKESGDSFGNKYGSYGLTDADGRYRVVNYVADENGFRADIRTNEPGTVPADPASTTVRKTAFLAVPTFAEVKTSPAVTGVKTAPPAIGIKTAPAVSTVKGVKTAPSVTRVKPASVASGFSSQPDFPPFPQSLLYAPDVHHAASPEYPLLYRNHFAPYGNYKGSPYTRRSYNTYKGSPYVGSPYVGSPYVGSPYVSSPYVSSPYGGRPYGRYGYYVYP